MKGFIFSLLTIAHATTSLVVAQDSPQTPPEFVKSKPNHLVTFLPVGQAPPFKIKGKGEFRILKNPAKFALPPKGLVIPSKKKQQPISLTLGQQNTYKIRLPKDRSIRLAPPSAVSEDEAPPWWRGKLPSGQSSLVVLFPNPKIKNWSKPLSLTLKNDAATFPPNAIRILNVSPYPLIVLLNKSKPIEIKPGKHYIYKGASRERKMAVYIKNKAGKPIKVYKANIDNKNTFRTDVAFYAGKPRRKGQPPVGVYINTHKPNISKQLSYASQ